MSIVPVNANLGFGVVSSIGSNANGGQLVADKTPQREILAQAAQKFSPVAQVDAENPFLNLEPQELWKHFDAITKIYRPSKNEEEIGNYIISIAQKNNLKYKRDNVGKGNIIIMVPATKGMENAPMTVVQGHMDMVCVNEKGEPHDFKKMPMKLKKEGGVIKAVGTTLGADNGIGLAAMLAIMDDAGKKEEDRILKHGPLALIITCDEDGDLTGALNLSGDFIPKNCEYLVNIDGDNVCKGYVGSAGDQQTTGKINLNLAKTNIKDPVLVKLTVSGCEGGHSGVDIHKKRANSIKLIAKVLSELNDAGYCQEFCVKSFDKNICFSPKYNSSFKAVGQAFRPA